MTIREVIGNAKNWIQGKLINDTVLDEYFEWWCDENDYNYGDEDDLHIYIDELSNNLYQIFMDTRTGDPNGSSIAEGFQVDYEDMMEGVYEDEYDEDSKWASAKQLAHSLSNPFADSEGYEWIPIVEAIQATFGDDARKIGSVEGTVGQKIALGFLMQGNDGGLDPIYVYHSF